MSSPDPNADPVTLMKQEVGRFIVGQEQIVEQVLTAVIAGGHVLLEGKPGLGKTLRTNAATRTKQTPRTARAETGVQRPAPQEHSDFCFLT